MATTQPTPQPPNPTTDSEETPPTTNQQTQEPVNPLITEEATGTELRVPTTSETATDLPIQSSHSGSTDIGLIIGIVVVVIVVIALVFILINFAVLFKRCGNVVMRKTGALANPVYGNKG